MNIKITGNASPQEAQAYVDYLQDKYGRKLESLDVLMEDVKYQPYDPENQYSVSYFWGTVGIVYDKSKVTEEELEEQIITVFIKKMTKLPDVDKIKFIKYYKVLHSG